MNAKKLFLWKYIVCLSLVISETFYFTLRIGTTLINDRDYSYVALNRYPISDIIISVAVVFVFSICLIYLILKITDKTHSKIPFYILILFTTFLIAISFKMFFDVADYSWHHVGSRNFYTNIKDAKTALLVRVLWFLTPFIASFIFVIFLRKDIHKIFNFLSILGLVFFVLMSYQMFSLKKLYSSFDRQDKYYNSQTDLKKQRKVVWIIFDEFDPEIAFSNQEHNYKLSNFIKLKKNSVTHHKLFSPSNYTFYSIPSMLIGEYVKDFDLRKHRLIMTSKDNKEIPFTTENTIFGRIENDGFSSSITGWGFHNYCLIFQVKCKIFNEPLKWYDGILAILHVNHIYAFLLHRGWHRDINPQIIKSMYEFIESPTPTNLLFIHNRVPHLCHKCRDGLAGLAEKFYDYKFRTKDGPLKLVSDRRAAYYLNIKLVDSILGEILNKLDAKEYKKEDTLLILNSDHWAKPGTSGIFPSREMDPKNSAYPALFIAKILGDNQKIELFEPDSGIHIQELVHRFLKKEISTHQDIKHFFEQKSGVDVYLGNNKTVFTVENDF
tara:strand:- start:364 stop:2019 length:1656 start_codon:yes stop_codon:yes gene_type:complete